MAVYDEYMTRLNDLQLEFEILRDEVDTPQQSEVFSRLDELSRLFSDLEMYLGKLVSEYEGERPGMAKDKVSNLEGLSLLLKFLGRGGFGEFSKPYHDVRTRLRQDLANNRTGTDASARSPAN